MKEIPIKKLYLIVFSTGAVIMILELIGSRILAPTLGTSIFIWTSLIGIILGAMSLGYFLGGKLADRNPSAEIFSLIIFFSGILIFFIIIIKTSVLEFSVLLGMKNGAVGAKVCGAGGGGSILFFGDKKKLKRKFGEKVIDFKFDFGGLRWF